MAEPRLTDADRQLLREQVFQPTRPGALLHDFRVVLEHLGERGVKASGKYHTLPGDCVPVLDPLLARPLRLNQSRPLLKSHPYLHGLSLLLVASGLAKVTGKGGGARLQINLVVQEAWNGLNPTEQYFALLEAWWLHSTPALLGEDDRGERVMDTLRFLLPLLADHNEPGDEIPFPTLRRVFRLPHQVALLDLFGFAVIERPAAIPFLSEEEGARFTRFGLAMARLVDEQFEQLTRLPSGQPRTLRRAFAEQFPAWGRGLPSS